MPPKIDLTEQRFGRLVVLGEAGRDSNKRVVWKCRCDCGNEIIVKSANLKFNRTKSCGCLHTEKVLENQTKHGMCKTKIYKIWANMMNRCYNPKNPNYKNYGGRGIKVYRPWWKFSKFYRDMGHKPKNLTLERINNKKGYCPNNCKWATQKEQARNVRCKGYYWNKKDGMWQAHIRVDYQLIHLGLFNKEKNARRAYLRAKKKYHTELSE